MQFLHDVPVPLGVLKYTQPGGKHSQNTLELPTVMQVSIKNKPMGHEEILQNKSLLTRDEALTWHADTLHYVREEGPTNGTDGLTPSC